MNKKDFCYRTWLADQIRERQVKNPAYSLRSFAKFLGMSPAHLSNMIANKRPLTLGTAKKIANRLGMPEQFRERFLEQASLKHKAKASAQIGYRRLQEQDFHLIDQWYHYAILELAYLPGNKCSAAWLAKRLRISKNEAQIALENMLRLNYIKRSGKSGFKIASSPLLVSHQVQSKAIQDFHKQIMDHAMRAVEFDDVANKLFSFRSVIVPPEKIPQIKTKIKEMQDEIIDYINKFPLDANAKVFAINTQFFSIDQGSDHAYH